MGAIVANGGVPMQLSADVIGSSPIDRVDIFHGKTLIRTVRPFSKDDLGKRIRVMWRGAEYRGRGREGNGRGKASVPGNHVERAQAGNLFYPAEPRSHDRDSGLVSWNSV